MDIKQCPNCQKQFDQDKRLAKQLSCGCVSCLKCLKQVYQFTQEIKCKFHQQVNNIKPEELQDYVVQQQVPQQDLPQLQEKFIDQEQINDQFRWLNDQYVQKQNHYRMVMKVIKDSSQFFQHIQSLSIKEILKTLIDQFSMSNDKVKRLLKRLSEFQGASEIQQQQQQDLIFGKQDPQISQNPQGQQQFQQILFEIEELKKNQSQWMDVQSLRVNVQSCMFNLFIYLSESSKGELLADREAECLVQKYFKQVKVQSSLDQGSSSVVHQKISFQSQHNIQQISQESQRIDQQQQQQNQVIDKQQGLDIVQVKQLLVQFLSKIKEENMSIQALQISPLNKSGLIEQLQILYQLPQLVDQSICLKLSEILGLAKNQPQIQQVAVNAITLLNYMNFDFTNQDFQNLDLSNSDLSDTTFTDCNFANSNFTQTNLRNTKFINCNLSNVNLTSIISEHPHIFTGHSNRVTAVAISNDSQYIVSGSSDRTIMLWDIKTGKSQTMTGHTGGVTSVAISSDSEFIVSGSYDKTIRLWYIKTCISSTMTGHTNIVTSIAISSDSEFIVSGSFDCTIILWNIKTGTCKTMSGHTDYVHAVAISSDSEFIVSGSSDCTIILWNIKTGTSKTMSGHSCSVNSVSISNDQQYIVSGSLDSTIRLWSTKALECIKVLKGHTSYVLSVIFSSSNGQIISGSHDKTIRVWSVQSGKQLCTICGHTEYVGSLSLSRDDNWLVSSNGSLFGGSQSTDYNFRRWNIGRLLNVSKQSNVIQLSVGEQQQQQEQVKLDFSSMYVDYGLGFEGCVMNGVLMSMQERERYIK